MNRRLFTLSLLGVPLLPACGGGGGSEATGPVSESSLGSSAARLAQPPIAAWGDSHTGGFPERPAAIGYASVLARLAPGRSVFNGGVAGETSTQVARRQLQDSSHRGWTSVFWYGGNNQWDPDTIAADLDRSVGALAPENDRYLILSVLNQAADDERRGGWLHARIVALNARLSVVHGDHFLDVRERLVDAAGQTPQDRQDQRDDVPPASLRADGVHLNEAGYTLVARAVLQALDARGW